MLPGGGPRNLNLWCIPRLESSQICFVRDTRDPQVQGTLLRLSNTATVTRPITTYQALSSGLITFPYPPSTLTFGSCGRAQPARHANKSAGPTQFVRDVCLDAIGDDIFWKLTAHASQSANHRTGANRRGPKSVSAVGVRMTLTRYAFSYSPTSGRAATSSLWYLICRS